MPNSEESVPDWSRSGLLTTAESVARQGTYGKYDTAGLRETRGKREEKGE